MKPLLDVPCTIQYDVNITENTNSECLLHHGNGACGESRIILVGPGNFTGRKCLLRAG